MPRDLPGFYWDPERNRYFPVNSKPAGAPAPTPALHPSTPTLIPGNTEVNRNQNRRRRRLPAPWTISEHVRSSVYEHERSSFHHALLATHYARTDSMTEERLPIFGAIKTFATVTVDGRCYRQIGDSKGWIYSQVVHEYSDLSKDDIPWHIEMGMGADAEISSMNICYPFRLSTSFGLNSSLHIQKLDGSNESYRLQVARIHDVRCSLFPSQDEAVLGAKEGIWLLKGFDCLPRIQCFKTYSDVFSLASDTNLIFAGTRNGSIHRFDLRISARDQTRRLVFPNAFDSTVTYMNLVNDTQLVVSYMNGQLLMYDIRYARQARPLLRFAGHVNSYTPRLGITMDTENDFLFAAGQDQRIRGWSLRTGEPIISSIRDNNDKHSPFCHVFEDQVEVMQVTKERKGVCLWTGCSRRLNQWFLGCQEYKT